MKVIMVFHDSGCGSSAWLLITWGFCCWWLDLELCHKILPHKIGGVIFKVAIMKLGGFAFKGGKV